MENFQPLENQRLANSKIHRLIPFLTKSVITILSLFAAVFLFVATSACNRQRSQSILLELPFSKAENFLSSQFGTNVSVLASEHTEVWGPKFLDCDTRYWVETKKYSPGKLLKFEAWYSQIGGASVTFTLEFIDVNTTRLTVDKVATFFITNPYCSTDEKRILGQIKKAIDEEKKEKGVSR